MFFERHRATLDAACAALDSRGYWSAYPEAPSGKIYGETANEDAKKAFEARLGQPFALDQTASGTVGAERSPYGFDLKIAYPRLEIEAAFANAAAARTNLRKAGVAARVGACLEILARLNKASFEIAYSVMHTTGQGFVMAFQAGGPHAQDRGLEAVATAWREMARIPAHARWEKPQGKNPPLVLDKDYRIVPKGIALAIGCATFPTWNTYPALFANLATGNPTLVKPHPFAILPLAITVRIAREVLKEAGLDPNGVQLMADGIYAPVAQTLAKRPEIAIIDYTGGPEFGDWLSKNAGHATIFAEKAGTNAVVVESTDNAKGMFQNLAFSLALYSGQMCTTPQNIFVPASGVKTPEGVLSPAEFGAQLATAIDKLLGDPARAAEVLGAIQNPAILARLETASRQGKVVRASAAMTHPNFPDATLRSPLVVALDASQSAIYGQEMFGPIAYLVTASDANACLDAAFGTIAKKGAITAAVYSTDEGYLAAAEERAADVGVALSANLTGGVFVNQSAAFSDYHATGCNPAANASLTDPGFVAPRFHVAQVRRTAAAVPA
ncbi:MAG: phenylacetic acid degradation protein PaaN [Proteobacteria bacterium]|nr:phenylacetic acid degradation protein PaaN [Pseudomonadota bacterium]